MTPNKSNRWILNQEKMPTKIIAQTTPGGELQPIDSGTKTIATSVKEEAFKVIEVFGKIEKVLPLTDKVLVSVSALYTVDIIGHDQTGELFNTFGLDDEDLPVMMTMIPLINYQQDMAQTSLDSLVGKKVKVKMIEDHYALEAELVSYTSYEFSHESRIALMSMYKAQNLNLGILDYLSMVGYDEESLQDFFKLKEADLQKSGVIRFENEAYWDKDMNKVKGLDIYLSTEEAPSRLLDRNYLSMKTQACHMPVIMFSGK